MNIFVATCYCSNVDTSDPNLWLAAAFDSDEDDGLGSSTDRRRESAPKAKSGGKGHSDKERPYSQRRGRWTCLRCFLRTKKVLARKAG